MAVKKNEVNFKQVGRNLNVTINGEVFTKTGAKEELTPLKELAKLAMEKPTKANVDKLVRGLRPKTEKKLKDQEAIKAEIKKEKRAVKSAPTKEKLTKTSSFEELKNKLKTTKVSDAEKKELLALLQVEEAKPVAKPQETTRRRGEW